MPTTERQTPSMPWSIWERYPKLDAKKLPLSIHVHQDEWKSEDLKPILSELMKTHIKVIKISGLDEDNIVQVLTPVAGFTPGNCKFKYGDVERPSPGAALDAIQNAEEVTKYNTGRLIVFYSSAESIRAELSLNPEAGKLSSDYVINKIIEHGETDASLEADRKTK